MENVTHKKQQYEQLINADKEKMVHKLEYFDDQKPNILKICLSKNDKIYS
jgi:hypothetical protein